jgi:hypothetical protein
LGFVKQREFAPTLGNRPIKKGRAVAKRRALPKHGGEKACLEEPTDGGDAVDSISTILRFSAKSNLKTHDDAAHYEI